MHEQLRPAFRNIWFIGGGAVYDIDGQGKPWLVEFTLGGVPYQILDTGPMFKLSEAVSIAVETDDQAETDRLWNALTANGGEESHCGWLKDRYGVSWQIYPKRLTEQEPCCGWQHPWLPATTKPAMPTRTGASPTPWPAAVFPAGAAAHRRRSTHGPPEAAP